jgi:deoxyribodipyrimidine photolyase-related protein
MAARAGHCTACEAAGVRLIVRDDLHFMASRAEFADHAQGKRRW